MISFCSTWLWVVVMYVEVAAVVVHAVAVSRRQQRQRKSRGGNRDSVQHDCSLGFILFRLSGSFIWMRSVTAFDRDGGSSCMCGSE